MANNSDRYAAIWEQADGPAWHARHGLTAAQYQQAFDQPLAEGYRLKCVSGYSLQIDAMNSDVLGYVKYNFNNLLTTFESELVQAQREHED